MVHMGCIYRKLLGPRPRGKREVEGNRESGGRGRGKRGMGGGGEVRGGGRVGIVKALFSPFTK